MYSRCFSVRRLSYLYNTSLAHRWGAQQYHLNQVEAVWAGLDAGRAAHRQGAASAPLQVVQVQLWGQRRGLIIILGATERSWRTGRGYSTLNN